MQIQNYREKICQIIKERSNANIEVGKNVLISSHYHELTKLDNLDGGWTCDARNEYRALSCL